MPRSRAEAIPTQDEIFCAHCTRVRMALRASMIKPHRCAPPAMSSITLSAPNATKERTSDEPCPNGDCSFCRSKKIDSSSTTTPFFVLSIGRDRLDSFTFSLFLTNVPLPSAKASRYGLRHVGNTREGLKRLRQTFYNGFRQVFNAIVHYIVMNDITTSFLFHIRLASPTRCFVLMYVSFIQHFFLDEILSSYPR